MAQKRSFLNDTYCVTEIPRNIYYRAKLFDEISRRFLIVRHIKPLNNSRVFCYSNLKFFNVHKNTRPISTNGFSIFLSWTFLCLHFFVEKWIQNQPLATKDLKNLKKKSFGIFTPNLFENTFFKRKTKQFVS